jgi:pyruvate dehydrogenase E1 component alpha subunit
MTSQEQLVFMLTTMLKIRHFENRVKELMAAGELPGYAHLYLGQEAVATGVCAALNETDYITSTHRGHGHIIAKGGDMKLMMAELYAKSTGYNKGKGGSLHIADPSLGILGANGIVGAGIPLATGAGMTAKVKKTGQVAVSFFGDGASNQGTFHEAINIASAFDLPVVYVCENNLYGVGTRQNNVRKIEDVADRAAAYGIPGVIVDGNDVLAVFEAATEAVTRARNGAGPTLLECKTYRWRTHFEGETDTYRPPEEVDAWLKREPVAPFRQQLVELNMLTAAQADEIEQNVIQEVDAAVEFGRQSPDPVLESALEDVWA